MHGPTAHDTAPVLDDMQGVLRPAQAQTSPFAHVPSGDLDILDCRHCTHGRSNHIFSSHPKGYVEQGGGGTWNLAVHTLYFFGCR